MREIWPDHKLVLICRKGLADFFLKTHLFDEVFEVTKNDARSYKHARLQLSAYDVDILFCPHESLRSALFSQSIKAQTKISFSKMWNRFFFTDRILKLQSWPDPLRQLSLIFPWDAELKKSCERWTSQTAFYEKDANAKMSDIPSWASMDLKEKIQQDDFNFYQVTHRFKIQIPKTKKWVLIFPGSVWATKMWTTEGFVKVGQKLAAMGWQVFVMGGPGEEALCKEVASQIPDSLDLSGRTSIYESALLLTRADLMIGNDSASTHLACLAGVPTVSIFGPTLLEFGFRPWSNQSFVVEKEGLLCRPCGPHGHQKCPLGTHECMKNISTDSVLQVIRHITQVSF